MKRTVSHDHCDQTTNNLVPHQLLKQHYAIILLVAEVNARLTKTIYISSFCELRSSKLPMKSSVDMQTKPPIQGIANNVQGMETVQPCNSVLHLVDGHRGNDFGIAGWCADACEHNLEWEFNRGRECSVY
jgi:hypothetical protein